jgi:hypothetical protein
MLNYLLRVHRNDSLTNRADFGVHACLNQYTL